MGTAEGRTHLFEQVHRKVDAFVLIVIESAVPPGKFVADFDRPGHDAIYRQRYILSRVYWRVGEALELGGALRKTKPGSGNRTPETGKLKAEKRREGGLKSAPT
jgi:hypothetical protein